MAGPLAGLYHARMRTPSSSSLLLGALLILSACGDKSADDSGPSGTGDDSAEPAGCAVAVTLVEADDDDPQVGQTVSLAATATAKDCDDALVYTWMAESSPEDDVSFEPNGSAEAAETTFVPGSEGLYVFSVTACSGETCESSDPVGLDVSSDNEHPVADAGDDQESKPGVEVNLDGSGSYDPEGSDLSYSWSFQILPSTSALTDAEIADADTATASFLPDELGVYKLALVVSDGAAESAPDSVQITVLD